jgi:hypothetical protein
MTAASFVTSVPSVSVSPGKGTLIPVLNETDKPIRRVLCIDGGGMRGVTSFEILARIEKLCGGPVRDSI